LFGSITPPMCLPDDESYVRPTRTLHDVLRVEQVSCHHVTEEVIAEEPLEIRLVYGTGNARREKAISVTMRTPGHDAELAAGFLLAEGVVSDADDIESVELAGFPGTASHSAVKVTVAAAAVVNEPALERNFYTTSGCGVCGRASLLALETIAPPRRQSVFTLPASVIRRLPPKLRSQQDLFAKTGGLHGAALVGRSGDVEHWREDVGRHNAVDKLIGAAALEGRLPLRENALLLSGRVSFDLMQKTVMAGIPMVIAIGAPSSLAVDVARRFDVTLVAFLREDHFNVYNGSGRVQGISAG
jgi:FdhD protein